MGSVPSFSQLTHVHWFCIVSAWVVLCVCLFMSLFCICFLTVCGSLLVVVDGNGAVLNHWTSLVLSIVVAVGCGHPSVKRAD